MRAIAETDFTFLSDCPCRVEIAIGDARLSLEREAPENFDVLAVDAFSGDSIPVHLLTREAMQLYFRHLKPDGILAVHISNRYLDLRPVVDGISRATGRAARLVTNPEDDARDVLRAEWVLVTAPVPGFDENIESRSEQYRVHRKGELVDRRVQQPVPDSEMRVASSLREESCSFTH